jgi:putative addiction module component (TIGR02574 family)
MSKSEVEAALLALPLAERIEVAEHLWASIEEETESGDLPAWQASLLDERLADLERNPEDGLSWDEVKAALQADLAKRRG